MTKRFKFDTLYMQKCFCTITGKKMQTDQEKSFKKWIMEHKGHSFSYASSLSASIYRPTPYNQKVVKKARILHSEYMLELLNRRYVQPEQTQEQTQEQPEHLERIQEHLEHLEQPEQTQEQPEQPEMSIEERIYRHNLEMAKANAKIEKLTEEATEREFFIKQQASTIEEYNDREAVLKSAIEARKTLIYIKYSDGSGKGYPSSLRFIDLSETIKLGQIEALSIIDVDWGI